MELRKNLELVDVAYESDNKKAVMTFLDAERGQVRTVNFNKQAYKDGKYIDDQEKADTVEQWCQDYFQTTFDKLPSQVGTKHDIYCYDRFNSLWETSTVDKFTKDMVGQIYQTEVKEIQVDNVAIRIRYDIEGKTYETKMTFANYVDSLKTWFEDPQKKTKKYEQFEDKFGVSVDEAVQGALNGHSLMVEVKQAFGSSYWGDIKKFPKKK